MILHTNILQNVHLHCLSVGGLLPRPGPSVPPKLCSPFPLLNTVWSCYLSPETFSLPSSLHILFFSLLQSFFIQCHLVFYVFAKVPNLERNVLDPAIPTPKSIYAPVTGAYVLHIPIFQHLLYCTVIVCVLVPFLKALSKSDLVLLTTTSVSVMQSLFLESRMGKEPLLLTAAILQLDNAEGLEQLMQSNFGGQCTDLFLFFQYIFIPRM